MGEILLVYEPNSLKTLFSISKNVEIIKKLILIFLYKKFKKDIFFCLLNLEPNTSCIVVEDQNFPAY